MRATLTYGAGDSEVSALRAGDGTLVRLPVGEDSALLPSLLTLSDVMGRHKDRTGPGRDFGATDVVASGGPRAGPRLHRGAAAGDPALTSGSTDATGVPTERRRS